MVAGVVTRSRQLGPGRTGARAGVPTASRVRLYRLSAERALAAIPAGSISLLLTDPAYTSINRHRGSGGHLQRWFPGGLSWLEIGRILAVARRKLRPDGIAFVMTNGDGLHDALGAMARAGFSRVRTITWDRRYPGLGLGLRHQIEFILVGFLPGSRTLTGVDLVSVAAVGPGTAGRWPTQKPDELGRVLARIAGIGPGDVVLDPFVGSGALLVGARERGAVVIGADVAPAALRLAQAKLAASEIRRTRPSSSRKAPTGTPLTHPKGESRPQR
jgi:site-specific DNA-methyltransferase (adenine-specific)